MKTGVQEKVQTFFEKYPKRTYPKDQIVVFGGEEPEKIFYIASGRICQYDISYRGDEIVINIFKNPAFFPMSWAINHLDNPYFFKAEEESIVYVAPPDEVILFLKTNPDVMFDLLSRLYMGVEGILARNVHLMSGSAKNRVMYELIIEADRFGKKESDNSLTLHINETELASHAGLARETISRELNHLKDSNLIEIRPGIIKIYDINLFKEQLGKVA